MGQRVSELLTSDTHLLEKKLIEDRLEEVDIECCSDQDSITADLIQKERELQHIWGENNPGFCPQCLKSYSLTCSVRPLTLDERYKLFNVYLNMKKWRAEQDLKIQLQNQRAREKLARGSGSSCITEDESGDVTTLDSEEEETQQKEKLAREKRIEEECRLGAVRVFLDMERVRHLNNEPSVSR